MSTHKSSDSVEGSQVTLKTVFTICFGVFLMALLGAALWRAWLIVLLIGTSGLLASSLNHLVTALTRRHFSRWSAIAVVLAGVVFALSALLALIIPPAVDQVSQFIRRIPDLLQTLEQATVLPAWASRFGVREWIASARGRLPEILTGAASPVLLLVGGVLHFVEATMTVVFVTIFMLIFGGSLVSAALGEALPSRRAMYEDVLEKIYASVGGYIGGLTVICCVNATCTTLFLALSGMPFFLPLGILSGFSSLVPYAGPLVMGVSITILAFISGGLNHGLISGLYFVIYGLLEGNVMGPLVFKRTVHVNPLLVLLAVAVFGEIAGVLGAVAAVPAAAILQIVLRELLRIRRVQIDAMPPEAGPG